MNIDKAFTDKLIKRLYQIDAENYIDLQVNRGELEYLLKQSRIDTLVEIKKKLKPRDKDEDFDNRISHTLGFIDTELTKANK